MPQSYSSLHAHIIFSTKGREPWLTPPLCERLYPYLGGILKNRNCSLLKVGDVEDHVHLLVRQSREIAMSDLVGAVKANSSFWIHETFPEFHMFAWQTGYAAFSVSLSGLNDVREYIDQQREHHRHVSFQDEFRRFLVKHEIEFDERYLWA